MRSSTSAAARGTRVFAALLAISVLHGACTPADSAAERHFADLRDQVNKMQADNDRLDSRVGALEIAADEKSGDQAAASARAGGGKPRGAGGGVVQLGPGETENDEATEGAGRTEIRLAGAGGGSSSAPRGTRGKTARRDDSGEVPSLRSDGARPSALDPEAKKAYENGLAQVQGKHYDKGLEALSAFLVRWPDHPYAENAMYWRGEAFYGQGEYLRAAEQFEAVLARFGAGSKGPDALLKLGMCHDRLGSSARAREYWDRLKSEFPKSDAAKRIPGTSRERDTSSKGPRENR